MPAGNRAAGGRDRDKDDLTLIAAAAGEAGRIALTFYRRNPSVWFKGARSPVSEADMAVNRFLEAELTAARPDYGWLSEETEDDATRLENERVFVVDPIDGTRAFLVGEDIWCVSIAVVRAGRTTAGVLTCPARDEVFTAAGQGPSQRNGEVIRVAAAIPDGGWVAAPKSVFRRLPDRLKSRMRRAAHVPSLACRLAMVADGRLTATFVKPNSHDWDLAAADLILHNAGGGIVDLDGVRPAYNRPAARHGALVAGALPVLPDLCRAAAVAA